MQFLVVIPMLLASACAGDVLVAVEPIPQHTQTHNTATGEYGFSYSGGPSSKTEFRALDGTTTGTYSYIDAHGVVQTVNYIADEAGFRASGTNIPAARKKRGILYPFAASVPTSTSSQSRFQIHNGAKIVEEVHTPIYPTLHVAPAALVHQPTLLLRKKRGILEPQPLVTHAAPLPPSSAKILDELAPKPELVAPSPSAVELRTAVPVAPAVEVRAAAPAVPIVENVPLSTSSQSRFQVHNDAKIIEEVRAPVSIPTAIVEAKAALPAAPILGSLPLSTSSQSRFQVHNGAKIIEQVHTPLYPAFQYAYPPSTIYAPGAIFPLAPQPFYPSGPAPLPAALPVEASVAEQPGQIFLQHPASGVSQSSPNTESGNNDSITVESAKN